MEDGTGADETGAVAPIATAVPPAVPPTSPFPGINVGVPEPACENYPLMLHSLLRLHFGVTFDHKSAGALSVVSMSKKPAGVAIYKHSMEQHWRSAGYPEAVVITAAINESVEISASERRWLRAKRDKAAKAAKRK